MANDESLESLGDMLKVTTAAVLVLLEDALDRQATGDTNRVTLLQNLHSELTAARARLN